MRKSFKSRIQTSFVVPAELGIAVPWKRAMTLMKQKIQNERCAQSTRTDIW